MTVSTDKGGGYNNGKLGGYSTTRTFRSLASTVVRDADHANIGDIRVLEQEALELGRCNLHSFALRRKILVRTIQLRPMVADLDEPGTRRVSTRAATMAKMTAHSLIRSTT